MLKTKDGYAKVIGTSYQGSSDYLLLSNGDSKAISSLSVNYATSAGNADTLDGVHLNGIFTAFQANGNATRLVIGGVTKDLTIPYSIKSNQLYSYSLPYTNHDKVGWYCKIASVSITSQITITTITTPYSIRG